MMMDHICPNCGEEMEHWNQGIYECPSCGYMADGEVLEECEEPFFKGYRPKFYFDSDRK